MIVSLFGCTMTQDAMFVAAKSKDQRDDSTTYGDYANIFYIGKSIRCTGQFVAFMILLYMFWTFTLCSCVIVKEEKRMDQLKQEEQKKR